MDISNKCERLNTKQYMGNNYQIGGTRHYRLTDGKSDGCRCIDVRTGSGFEYTVVCDRGLDISLASFRGTNLVHLTENLESNPAFYNPDDSEWLRTFSAGLLTTCGPENIGPPCSDNSEALGLHGRWSALSGKQVCDLTSYDDGTIEIKGQLYDSYTFGSKYKIDRTIKSEFGKSFVIIEDAITNEGGASVPLNVLYHINLGYPFLDETVDIHIPSAKCVGYDEYSNERLNEQSTIKSPSEDNYEKNYLHTFNNEESVVAWVHNKNIGDGLIFYIKFNSKLLPYLTQWTFENIKDYVLAIEPANVPCLSREKLRKEKIFPLITPGETVNLRVEIGVIDGKENIEAFCNSNK